MNFHEEFLFWKLVHYFIENNDYRILQISQNQKEIWLEKLEDKNVQITRILLHNLDWSNWLQHDIDITLANGENIRKQLRKRSIHLLNIYVTTYPPVDDYEFRIAKPSMYPNSEKTKVTSVICDRQNGIKSLESFMNDTIEIAWKEEYDEDDINAVKQNALISANNKVKAEKSLFENGRPFITYIFIAIQLLVFILMEAAGGSTNTSTLIKFGAKVNILILEGEWWRLVTPIVLHIGILHLAMNTFALYYIGMSVERIFGSFRFLLIYLFAGFSGSLASLLFSPSISAGASGAIFGCFGALLYFGTVYPKQFLRTMGFNIIFVIGINLLFGFSVPGIDNAGHIGGLIGGFLASLIVHFPKKKRILLQLTALFLSGGMVFGILHYSYTHIGQFVNEQSSIILAQNYIEKEDFNKAHQILEDYINEKDDTVNTLFLLSYTEIKTGRMDEAIKHLHQVIKMKSDFHEAFYNLSLVYLNEEKYDEAKLYAEQAVKLQPSNKDYQKLLAEISGSESAASGA